MQSNTIKVVETPVKAKEEIKEKVSKETPVKEEKPKENIIKEIKCSLICGEVNYIIQRT